MIAAAAMLTVAMLAATVPSDVPAIEDCAAIVVHRSRNAELSYVSVGFHRRGAPAVRMYYVEDGRLIAELFRQAAPNRR